MAKYICSIKDLIEETIENISTSNERLYQCIRYCDKNNKWNCDYERECFVLYYLLGYKVKQIASWYGGIKAINIEGKIKLFIEKGLRKVSHFKTKFHTFEFKYKY